MSWRNWPIVFSTTSYFDAVSGFLLSGGGGCGTTRAFVFEQDSYLNPPIVSDAISKLAIEQISAAVRSLISGASASRFAVASTMARTASEVVAVTREPRMTKCRTDLLLPGGRVSVLTYASKFLSWPL